MEAVKCRATTWCDDGGGKTVWFFLESTVPECTLVEHLLKGVGSLILTIYNVQIIRSLTRRENLKYGSVLVFKN